MKRLWLFLVPACSEDATGLRSNTLTGIFAAGFAGTILTSP